MKITKEIIEKAYQGTSFSPEKRAESDLRYYSELLANDLSELGENTGNYEQKFNDKLLDYYRKRSSCFSTMITGPANFPVRQQAKKWASADRALEHFNYWREKYFTAANRARTLSPEGEIDKTLEEIESLTRKRDLFKEFNNLAKNLSETERVALAADMLPPKTCEYYSEEIKKGNVPSWSITSLTTKIRERHRKLEIMRRRIERKESQDPVKFVGGKIYIENDRVIISHDEKPDREIIEKIKSNGFRWSPKCKNWCRKHTENAIYSANYLLNNVFGGKIEV